MVYIPKLINDINVFIRKAKDLLGEDLPINNQDITSEDKLRLESRIISIMKAAKNHKLNLFLEQLLELKVDSDRLFKDGINIEFLDLLNNNDIWDWVKRSLTDDIVENFPLTINKTISMNDIKIMKEIASILKKILKQGL